jgi:hypothetical protein
LDLKLTDVRRGGGPDPKTTNRILARESVTEGVLKKLARSLGVKREMIP